MSAPPNSIRRADLAMNEERARLVLSQGYAGRIATVGADGWPYVVPLLYVWKPDVIYLHNSQAPGHLRANVENCNRVCFLVDEPGTVYAYGRFECDSALSYSSVMAFGTIRIVDDEDEKASFCEGLMEKYASGVSGRPKGFYPRLDHITVYAIQVERLTGKEIQLPPASAQWPVLDRTKSPSAQPPTLDGQT
jgi:nitroimidazol reductase NimA-like FMN-containing flavoprotein (pyridoxamine 5'-phosphate oxidase superfamily)